MFSKSMLTVAHSYAKAVFDFAFERDILDKWELMLAYAKSIVLQNPIVIQLLSFVDCIRSEELSEIFILLSQHKLDCFGQNFIRILAEYKRLCLIPMIFKEFLFLCRERKMVLKIEIISSVSLTDNEILKIMTIMKRKFLYQIDLTCKLDQSIIGGIIIHINDLVIDGSVQGCIKRLKYILDI